MIGIVHGGERRVYYGLIGGRTNASVNVIRVAKQGQAVPGGLVTPRNRSRRRKKSRTPTRPSHRDQAGYLRPDAKPRRGARGALLGALGAILIAAVGSELGGFRWSALMERITGGDPIRVSAHSYRDGDQALTWALPENLGGTTIPSGNGPGDGVEAFAKARGGTDVGFTHVEIDLTGRSDRAIITDVRPEIVSQAPPMTSTLIWGTPEGSGEIPNLVFGLDEQTPVARRLGNTSYLSDAERNAHPARQIFSVPLGQPYFKQTLITLEPGEVQKLIITGQTERHELYWRLSVDVQTASGKRTIIVGNGGTGKTSRPFHTTALAPSVDAPDSSLYKAIYFLYPPHRGWQDPRTFCADGDSLCSDLPKSIEPMIKPRSDRS